MSSRTSLITSLAAALLAACATVPTTAPPPPRDEVTAAALERVLAGEHRSAENRARDAFRHPHETLLFFGVKPEMTVVEVWPGAGGWYTEILAPLLRERRPAVRGADAATARQRIRRPRGARALPTSSPRGPTSTARCG